MSLAGLSEMGRLSPPMPPVPGAPAFAAQPIIDPLSDLSPGAIPIGLASPIPVGVRDCSARTAADRGIESELERMALTERRIEYLLAETRLVFERMDKKCFTAPHAESLQLITESVE